MLRGGRVCEGNQSRKEHDPEKPGEPRYRKEIWLTTCDDPKPGLQMPAEEVATQQQNHEVILVESFARIGPGALVLSNSSSNGI